MQRGKNVTGRPGMPFILPGMRFKAEDNTIIALCIVSVYDKIEYLEKEDDKDSEFTRLTNRQTDRRTDRRTDRQLSHRYTASAR